MQRKIPAVLAVVVALAFAAHADELVTKTGTKYTGRIVSEDDSTVTIDTAALGRLNLAKSDLSKIQRDPKPGEKGGDAEAKASDGKAAAPAAKPAAAAAKPGDAPAKPADPAAKPADGETQESPEEAAAKAAAAAAKAKADAEAAAALLAEEREARRRATKIVRKTAPQAAKPAAAAAAAAGKEPGAAAAPDADEPRASIGGSELAKADRGALVVVYLPPKQFEGTPSGIQIGKRFFARLDSAGTASAWLSLPMAAGDEQILTRLADVQRHVTLKMGQSRLARMVEGIDRGAWLRVRLDDGSVVQGMLQSVEGNVLGLQRPKADGTLVGVEVAEEKVIELDGLLRSTSTRLILNDLAAGEPIALMMWPEAREVVGVLKARTDLLLTVDTGEGGVVTVPVEGPVAEARRVPAKWRNIVASFSTKTTAHARSAEDFADARVERDLIGTVSALTAYALVLDTPDGVLVLPWDTLTQVSGTDTTSEAALAKPMKKSERAYRIPVKPGDPADKAKEADAESGVSVVTDGSRVKNVLVSAPYDGDVFGISLGDRVDDAEDRTDIRFDTIVTQRRSGVLDGKPSELISNSLEHVRVTLLLDSSGSVSAIELGAR